jgi:hypothetical protein
MTPKEIIEEMAGRLFRGCELCDRFATRQLTKPVSIAPRFYCDEHAIEKQKQADYSAHDITDARMLREINTILELT